MDWACVTAVVIAAGLDARNLFYLGMMRLASALYARIALLGIRGLLGARVVCEFVGALAGAATGWYWFSRRIREESVASTDEIRTSFRLETSIASRTKARLTM